MKISAILDLIDTGSMALPEFQRGFVWNRDQVRGLMASLYQQHPVGSLLVWVTRSEGAQFRGDGAVSPGVVKLLLDGQQRMTSLYGIVRGQPPRFFDGDPKVFTGLRFHLGKEDFAFYSPVHMRDDPLWIDVSELMINGHTGIGAFIQPLSEVAESSEQFNDFLGRLNRVLAIREIDLHVEEVTGEDKTIDVVVDIFNRVNSGGTKLSKGDLALAKICADWPEAREALKSALGRWDQAGYHFELDWLLRCVNTILTGEAKFLHLHDASAADVQDGLRRAERSIDCMLDLISGRFGLDHDRVFFGRYAMPVMAHYLDRRGGRLRDAAERDRLLFWFVHAAMWGRFSGSTESYIDQDLRIIEELDGALDRLIDQLRLWHGGLSVQPGHFGGWSLGARFYPVLYLLTRVHESCDWGNGLPLRDHLRGKMNRLEVHHIFPKAQLYKRDFRRPEVNAVANFCFLTKDTNLQISDRLPSDYFPEIEVKHPGTLASQWIPMDPDLWQVERYLDFLEARKQLLAEAANRFLLGLLHGEVPEHLSDLEQAVAAPAPDAREAPKPPVPGAIDSEEEERELEAVNAWTSEHGLPRGELAFELRDPSSGEPVALLDLAWEKGLQQGYSQPVALLLGESPETLAIANRFGYRYFTDTAAFRHYIEEEILAQHKETFAVAV